MNHTATTCEVIKFGGSLLALPDPADCLSRWLANKDASNPPHTRVIIGGGGCAVEALRQDDATNSMDWAAIDIMDRNTQQLADKLPALRTTSVLHELGACDYLFAPAAWLRETEPTLPGIKLGVGWQVTSDSIAARIAEVLGASLTLLKSTDPVGDDDWQAWAEAGLVDSDFSNHASRVQSIKFVNLLETVASE